MSTYPANSPSAINWFFTRRILRKINRNIEQLGFAVAFERIIHSVSKKMRVIRHPDAYNTLANDCVLLITNHPAEMDAVILLGSLPNRKETYMLINHVFMSVLPAFDPHCIPVYVSYRLGNEVRKSKRSKVLDKIHFTPKYSVEESKDKNKASIVIAAHKINEGGVVLLAPGFGNDDKEFKTGLGYLLNNLPDPARVKIIMTYISGASKIDYLRFIPLIKYLLPRYSIVYSGPTPALEFVSGDIKGDTLSLQNFYFNWVEKDVLA